MPSKPAAVEFLSRLVHWAGNRQEFCRLTGIYESDLSAYLSQSKAVSWKRLKRAAGRVFGEPPAFIPIVEGWNLQHDGIPLQKNVGHEEGIYALFDSARRTVYFGKAGDLYSEIRQTLGRTVRSVRDFAGPRNLCYKDISTYLSAFRIVRGDADFRHDVEALGLSLLVNTTFNTKGGEFRRSS